MKQDNNDIKHPLTLDNDSLSFVGKLVKGKVVCPDCYTAKQANQVGRLTNGHASLYLINVLPYNQTCSECYRLIVKGGENCPVLFV